MDIHKKYKFVKEHDKHFEIHDSTDGKRFKVAKKDLHPAHQLKVLKMQKLNEGGTVNAPPSMPDPQKAKDAWEGAQHGEMDRLKGYLGLGDKTQSKPKGYAFGGGPDAEPEEAEAESGVVPGTEDRLAQLKAIPGMIRGLWRDESAAASVSRSPEMAAPAQPDISGGVPPESVAALQKEMNPQTQASAASPQDPLENTPYGKAFDLQEQAVKGMAGAQQYGFQEAARAEADYQKQMRDFNYTSQQESWNKKTELDNLQSDIEGTKIDPNRLWHQAGTGSKIAAGLALVLGGIGAGLTHGPNQALQTLDKMTERDLEAQKANLGKKETLYSMNMHRYNNQQVADQATRLQMNTMLQSQLKIVAAKSGSMQAGEAAKMMIGQLEVQRAQMLMQYGATVANAKILGLGSGQGGIPVSHVPYQLLSDPKFQEKLVVIDGKAYQANDKEAAGKVRDIETLAGPIADNVQKLKSLDQAKALIPGSEENNLAKGIMGDLAVKLPLLSGATIGAKRVNSEEIAHQVERIKDPTKWRQVLGGSKDDYLLESLMKDVDTVRNKHLINYKGMSGLGFSGASGNLPLNKKGK